jgi:hypothetical protein
MRKNNTYNSAAIWLALLLGGMMVCGAETPVDAKLAEAVQNLDSYVQEMDLPLILADLAATVELKSVLVERALREQGLKYSDIVLLKAVATKTGQDPEQLLPTGTVPVPVNWMAQARAVGVPDEEIYQKLENAQADLGFRLIDKPMKQRMARKK